MSQNNALVEIALALAMAFFSIMILSMVSMGVSKISKVPIKTVKNDFMESIKIRRSQNITSASKPLKGSQSVEKDRLVIFYKKIFYDASLQVLSANEMKNKNISFVAISPKISAIDAVNVRRKIPSPSASLMLLNDVWLKRLKEKTNEQ